MRPFWQSEGLGLWRDSGGKRWLHFAVQLTRF